jgi:thiamine pyrophosphate-dependent acetolactate synthase large subunit-like protein
MNRETAIRSIITATRHQPVIFTSGDLGRIARDIADRPTHLYLTSSAGLASSTGIGVALQTRGTTVVVDGYGSVLTNLAGLVTAGMLTDLPLVHIVLDDEWDAVADSAPPAQASRADLCGMALAAGYSQVHTMHTQDAFVRMVRRQVATCAAPVFLRCVLYDSDAPTPKGAAVAFLDSSITFRRQQQPPPPDWTTAAA